MKAEYTLINNNATSVSLNSLTLPPRSKATRTMDLTLAQVAELNRMKVDVLAVVGGTRKANAAIFEVTPEPVKVAAPVGRSIAPVVLPAAPVTPVVLEDNPTSTEPTTPLPPEPSEVPATEDKAPDADEAEDEDDESPRDLRTMELLAMNGNTLKAMAKKPPYSFTSTDGMAKAALVEKMVEFEFSASEPA